MPATAWQVHSEIDRAVCKVDECSRAFAKCWGQAKGVVGMKDKEKHATELKKVISSLRQHKTQIRKLTAQGNVPPSSKDRLKDAQDRIERDLRRFQEFEQSFKGMAASQVFDGQENVAPPAQDGVKNSSVSGEAKKGEEAKGSAPSEAKVQYDQLVLDDTEDKQVIEEFVCKICQVHVVGCGPKLSRCSHLYCGDCIAQWFDAQPRTQSWAQRAQGAGTVPCPVCKEPLKWETDLFSVCAGGRTESTFLYRMLSGLKVRCANHSRCRADGKCDWTGTYGNIQAHMRGCQNEPLGSPGDAEEDACRACAPAAEGDFLAGDAETEAPSTRKNTSGSDCSSSWGEGAALAVVDESPDAAADEPDAAADEPQDEDPAAEWKPASLTDLIRSLVDLKVQSHEPANPEGREEAEPPAAAAEPVQEEPTPSPVAAAPTAQPVAAECVSVVLPYAAGGPSQLTLRQGDFVEVQERSESGWVYGRKVLDASLGWFPSWAIAA